MLDGQPEDIVSIADAATRMCRLAGLDRVVEDIEPSDDPEVAQVFGPTLVAIAKKAARQGAPRKSPTDTKTYKRLGYDPISLDDGLGGTLEWFRQIGRLDPR